MSSLFSPGDSDPIAYAFDRGLAAGGVLYDELSGFGDYRITTEAEALSLVRGLERLGYQLGKRQSDPILHLIAGLFQGVDSREAFEILQGRGVPYLLDAFDSRMPDESVEGGDTLLFLLKIAALFRVEGAIERISVAAYQPLEPDSFLWSVLFGVFDENHPYRMALVNRLREPIPGGFIGVAYLDLANAVAREGYLTNHPFDTARGRPLLREWLTDPATPSYALSAAGSLSFIDRPDRDELFALAMDHPSVGVQLEAARASARLGSEAALKFLARACLEPNHGKRAADYLLTLGQGGMIPAEALRPDFQALAEMASWLAHPTEFGRSPDGLEIVDSRELFWPPTNDRRRLWIVRYQYAPCPPDDPGGSGVGLVGSITFCLFGMTSAGMSPKEVYALHCGWELQVGKDPRAPEELSVERCRALLEEDGGSADT